MQEEKMDNTEKKNQKSKKYIIILFLLVLLVGGSCGFYYIDTFYGQGKINAWLSSFEQKQGQTQQEEITPEEEGTQANSISLSTGGALFSTKGKKFLMCTTDGVKYMNGMGDQIWNDTFTMGVPELIEEGKYWAVGDLSGKGIKVYSEAGAVYSVQVTGNILYFALNENGYLGVITKEKDVFTVMIYNNTGTQLTGRREGEKGVYPLGIDISDDNRVFCISYLDTTDIEPIGRVAFFYVNESEGKNFTESMFASKEIPNELIPKIFYMQNGTLVAVSDLKMYGFDSNGQQRWEKELTNYIHYIAVEEKKYIAAAYADAISGHESRQEGTVCWINEDGKEIASFQAKSDVTYLNCNDTGTVIGCGKTYYGLKTGGRAFWEYTATSDMVDVILMENVDHVLFVTKDKAAILNMNSVSQDTTVTEGKQESRNTQKVIENTDEQQNQQQEQNNTENTTQADDMQTNDVQNATTQQDTAQESQ